MNLFKRYRQLKRMSTTALLEESPQLPLIFWGVIVISTIILLLILWASFATIQETAITYGEVVPMGHEQKVQHLEGGIVQQVFVSNGDEVKKGQLLIKMDEAASKAELEKARSQEIALTLNKERLEAYLEKKPANLLKWSQAVIRSKYNTVDRSEEIKELLEEEKALLASQNEKRQNQESILKDQLTQEQEQLKKFEHQLQVWDQHLKLLTEELEIFKKLKREQYVSHRGYLTILRELNR
ncbi:biotin/lipoyl-binding protein [Candidiatus Paracoxiella cheracis]|uniref:biotin/lipoyl-binding protein n=1 Tax=Candidiatus Paracoxiella cheracis TaxID=3405120 RepID=UPI003BF577FA